MSLLEKLGKSYLCSGMTKDEVEKVASIVLLKRLSKEELLFFEGDPAHGFFILLSGKVRIYKASPDGKEYTIHLISPGQLFAEAAIFKGDVYPANGAAIENSEVAYVPKDKFLGLLKGSPQIALKIIGALATFVRDFNRQVEELSLKEVPARLASYLLFQAEQKISDSFTLEISKTELANHLGTISETLSRNLKKLKESGFIEVNGKEIKITNFKGLNSIADGGKI